MRRKVVVAILIIIGMLGVVALAGDNPDWTLPVSVRAQEIENLSVDIAAQSISELNIRITSQAAPVDVNITNASLDVYVTNSTLTVNVDGTADVNITNAQLNVQTLKEQASAAGNITYARDTLNLSGYTSDVTTIYTNTGTSTVYLEAVYIALDDTDTYDDTCHIVVQLQDDAGNVVAEFYGNPPNFPMNFDPAVPVPPGYKIVVAATRYTSNNYFVDVSALIRTS